MLLDGLSFTIEPNEAVGLVGRSGAGKSTLAAWLGGRPPAGLSWARGEVELFGALLQNPAPDGGVPVRPGLAVLWQDAGQSFDPLTTVASHIEEVGAVTEAQGRARPAVSELLSEVGLDPAVGRAYPHQLSGGMLQRAQLAVVLAGDPELIIADEPTTALDPPSARTVLAALANARRRKPRALLFISHDLELVLRITTRTLVLANGRIVEEGPSEAIRHTPQSEEAQALVSAGALRRA